MLLNKQFQLCFLLAYLFCGGIVLAKSLSQAIDLLL